MAKDKKSFISYCDWLETFEECTDEEAGRLVKHLFRYVNDLDPEAPDRMTKMLFLDIKRSLKRDLRKYEQRAERARENGKKGGRPKTQKTQSVNSEPRKPDSVNVNVNVTDTVNDTYKINPEASSGQNLLSWIDINCTRVQKLEKPLTLAEAERLAKEYKHKFLVELFQEMENYKKLHRSSTSANLTFRKWARKDDRYGIWLSNYEQLKALNV